MAPVETSQNSGTSLTHTAFGLLVFKSNAQIHNIHFICTSNKAPVMEMAVPLVHELQSLKVDV